jgi:two-component system sensor histidine kinase RegB
VSIVIRDDGPGFAEDIIGRLGDPFVTTREGYDGPEPDTDIVRHQGMGLGFFIAKTLLERSGASVTLANRKGGHSGALVKIGWQRQAIEVKPVG